MSRSVSPYQASRVSPLACAVLLCLGAAAHPYASAADPQVTDLGGVVVSATRGARNLVDVPRSITVLNREDIEQQLKIANDIGTVLGNLVPGMGASVQGRVNGTGQDMIRGRRLQLVVDGVVMNNGFLDFREEFNNIDPDLIERIEVVRGGSATYGFGAAGGVIVITTRKPQPGQSYQASRIGMNFQPADIGDSLGWTAHHAANWASDRFGARLSVGYTRRNEQFDGDGDRRPSDFSLDNTRDYSLSGGFSWFMDERQQFDLSVAHINSQEHDKSIAVGANPLLGIKARPVHVGVGINDLNVLARVGTAPPVMRKQTHVTAHYDHADLLGSRFNLMAYYLERENRTSTLIFNTGVPLAERPVGYNHPLLKRSGMRATFDTRLGGEQSNANLQWGLDYDHVTYVQPNSAGLTNNSPDITNDGIAAFAQLETPVAGSLRFVGGLRYESQEAKIPTFVVSETYFATTAGNVVQGGSRRFGELIGNAAFLYDFNPSHTGYVSFSQGFTSGEILRAIRNTAAASVREAVELEPQIVDNYEIGLRGFYDTWSFNLAAFYTESDLGVTFVFEPDTLLSTIERAPERIWGAELSVDSRRLANGWQAGGSISWQDGERRMDGGNVWEPLPGGRVNPIKLNLYVGQQATERFGWRLQSLYTGSRDEFPGSTLANEGKVDSVLLLDASATYRAAFGEFSLGVSNLLDKMYIPPYLQANNLANNYYGATGRTLNLNFRREW